MHRGWLHFKHHCPYCVKPVELTDQGVCRKCNKVGCAKCTHLICTLCSKLLCKNCAYQCYNCKKIYCDPYSITLEQVLCCDNPDPYEVWENVEREENIRRIKEAKEKQLIAHETYKSMKAIRKMQSKMRKRGAPHPEFRKKITRLLKECEQAFGTAMQAEDMADFTHLSFFK